MLKIGGTILLGGKSLEWVTKKKDGSVDLTFSDSGSCETSLVFSAENFRRLAEAVSLFTFGKKDKISFDEDKGEVTAEDIIILLERQAVRFKVSNGDEREIIPTIRIQPLPGKDDLNSGFGISMNEAQASELVERLGMFLEAALLRRTASKTKTIAAPARTKRTTAPASA